MIFRLLPNTIDPQFHSFMSSLMVRLLSAQMAIGVKKWPSRTDPKTVFPVYRRDLGTSHLQAVRLPQAPFLSMSPGLLRFQRESPRSATLPKKRKNHSRLETWRIHHQSLVETTWSIKEGPLVGWFRYVWAETVLDLEPQAIVRTAWEGLKLCSIGHSVRALSGFTVVLNVRSFFSSGRNGPEMMLELVRYWMHAAAFQWFFSGICLYTVVAWLHSQCDIWFAGWQWAHYYKGLASSTRNSNAGSNWKC